MSRIVEDLIDSEKREIELKMLQDGKLSKEDIARYCSLAVEQVEELEDSLLLKC